MPAIKKKWIKASHKDENESSTTGAGEDAGDDERDLNDVEENKDGTESQQSKPVKRSAQSPKGGMLKGLDGEVLLEKRKRFVPSAELKLNEWLESNIEQRTDETLPLSQLYGYYTELCQGEGWDVLDVPEFNKVIKGKYGKTFGLTKGSVLTGLLKERKLNKEKKKPHHGIKMKDVIHEAIQHFGNPSQGVRFFSLKQFIGTKYPALQIDMKPKVLKRALEFGVGYGQLDLVKGIGMMGFYKLPGDETKPKAEKDDADGNKDGEESKEAKEGDKEKADDSGEKSQEGSADDKENKEEGTEEKKKQHKPKKPKPVEYSRLSYSNPERIEDTFPLAITYQSAPKVVGLPKIRKYIAEKYNEEVTDNRWRQVISKGADNGLWEHTSGSGISGSIHLLMDDFDPQSNQIEDQVCAAIIACHEPKSASAGQIKKYVSQYHPDFKIDERPDRFKKALLRAVNKSMITQVSGLGASGSFQLTGPFMPTPAILAGEDDSDIEEEDSDEEPAYVSKGTKSRGIPKLKTQEKVNSSSRKAKANEKASKGRGRPMKRKSYAEESDEDSDAPASKKKKKVGAGKKSPGRPKGMKREPSPLSDEDDEEDLVEYTPRKTKSRGGSDKVRSQPKAPAKKAAPKPPPPAKAKPAAKKEKSTPSKSKARSPSSMKKKKVEMVESDADDEDEDEDEEEPEYTPRKSRSRGGDAAPPSSKQTASKSRKKSKK